MSSNLRAYAQIPSTVRYLEVVRTVTLANITNPSDMAAFLINDMTDLARAGDIVVESTNTITGRGVPVAVVNQDLSGSLGTLYKDLGRQILIVDSSHRHVALFRQVQEVDGVGAEGVSPTNPWASNIFVKVWAADSNNVVVARTGPGGSA